MRYLIACFISLGVLGTALAQDQPEYTGKGKFRDQGEQMDQTNDMTIQGQTQDEVYVRGEDETEEFVREEEDQTFNRSYDYLREEGQDPYMKQRSEMELETETETNIEGSAQGTEKTVPEAEGSIETESSTEETASGCLKGQMNYLNPDLGRNVDSPKNMDYKYEMKDGETTIEYEDDDMKYFSEQNKNGESQMEFESGNETFWTETKKGETETIYELDGENESVKIKKNKDGSGKVDYEGDFQNLDQANSEVFDDVNKLGNFGTYSQCQ